MLNSWEMFTEDVMKTGTDESSFIVEEMSKVVNLVRALFILTFVQVRLNDTRLTFFRFLFYSWSYLEFLLISLKVNAQGHN